MGGGTKEYRKPELEVIELSGENVIVTSGGRDEEEPDWQVSNYQSSQIAPNQTEKILFAQADWVFSDSSCVRFTVDDYAVKEDAQKKRHEKAEMEIIELSGVSAVTASGDPPVKDCTCNIGIGFGGVDCDF